MTAPENGSAEGNENKGWKPNKRDLFFLGFVAIVIIVLILGTSERTTKPTPNDEVHQKAVTLAACMKCHDSKGVKPYPPRHVQGGQCFQCHVQPAGWQGGK